MLTKIVATVAGCFIVAKVVVPLVGTEAPPETFNNNTGQWEQQSHHYDPKEDPCYLEDGEQGPPCRDFIPPLG